MGIPTKAYYDVEEVKEIRNMPVSCLIFLYRNVLWLTVEYSSYDFRLDLKQILQ